MDVNYVIKKEVLSKSAARQLQKIEKDIMGRIVDEAHPISSRCISPPKLTASTRRIPQKNGGKMRKIK